MKQTAAVASLALAMLTGSHAAEPAEAPDQQVLVLVQEIQAQQITIAENWAKFDAKLGVVSEAIRVARIYSGRGG